MPYIPYKTNIPAVPVKLLFPGVSPYLITTNTCLGVKDPAESVSPNLYSQTGGLHLRGQVSVFLTWNIRDHFLGPLGQLTHCLT